MSGPISDHIRSNIWAIAACFIAAMGTAVVASASNDGPAATKSASAKKQIKKLKKVVAAQGARIAALEAKPATPTGPASGDLTGSYPNPQIGANAVGTDELADQVDSLRVGIGEFPGSFTGLELRPIGIDIYNSGNHNGFFDISGAIDLDSDLVLNSGKVSFREIADPGTPPANRGWLYVEESGGSSRLVIEWNDSKFVIDTEDVAG